MIEYSSCFGEQVINAAAAKANNDKRLGTGRYEIMCGSMVYY
jgi:hypothetical protein